jgi:hypothetical protein
MWKRCEVYMIFLSFSFPHTTVWSPQIASNACNYTVCIWLILDLWQLNKLSASAHPGQWLTVNCIMYTNCYIKTNEMHCTLFLLLIHFTPTCFDVRNVIFRECTKSFLHLLVGIEPTSKCKKKKFWYLSIFRKSIEKIQVLLKSDRYIMDILHEDLRTFLITSPSVLLRIRNISDKNCRENRNTNFMCNNFFRNIVPFMR